MRQLGYRSAMLLMVALTSCTAAKAGVQIVGAESRLGQAREQGAAERSQYEYTLAQRYLEKAREEAAGSEYRVADALARASAEWSDKAVIALQSQRTVEIDSVPTDVVAPAVTDEAPVIDVPDDGIEDFDTPAEEGEIEVDGPK